jgi:hypothetical protein
MGYNDFLIQNFKLKSDESLLAYRITGADFLIFHSRITEWEK